MVKISLRYGIIKKILILHLIMKIFKVPIHKLSPLKGSSVLARIKKLGA